MKSYTVITSKETTTGLNWVIDAKAPLSAFSTFLDDFTIAGFLSRFCVLSSINTHG